MVNAVLIIPPPTSLEAALLEVCFRPGFEYYTGQLIHIFLGYSVREELPLPSKPPFTVHLGNLSFDATTGDVTDFFTGCECINVRIIEDKVENKPKGFGYAEFGTLEGLKQALTLNGSQFQGRNIRISVADPRKYDTSFQFLTY